LVFLNPLKWLQIQSGVSDVLMEKTQWSGITTPMMTTAICSPTKTKALLPLNQPPEPACADYLERYQKN